MNNSRKHDAQTIRATAAELAEGRPHPRHIANGDEHKFRRTISDRCGDQKSIPSYLASFTKGMPHNHQTGLISNHEDFQNFVKGIDSGNPRDFKDTSLGPEGYTPEATNWWSDKAKYTCSGKGAALRAWESQGAGNTFDLEGPDAQAVTMPPAPIIGSDELIAEMGEVYAQALLRDVPFTKIVDGTGTVNTYCEDCKIDIRASEICTLLNTLTWFKPADHCCDLSAEEINRKRTDLNGQTIFRGITPGDRTGPYISQFLLAGNKDLGGNSTVTSPEDGLIAYGAITIDQRVRYATPCLDYMTTWHEWIDVQQGANVSSGEDGYEDNPKPRRFITTPRDIATYVHFDALYEAYLNACLILLGNGIPFDPGIPFQGNDHIDHQQGFAHFGGPHILSLLTEVATRALKAVRFQKFNIHRRLRPEALAARLAKHTEPDVGIPEIKKMVTDLQPILDLIAAKNPQDAHFADKNYLLPMAFCEGSPMHPAYGAGHATVAGACITILKAFFDHKHPLAIAAPGDASKAFVPTEDGCKLIPVDVIDKNNKPATLTVEGELNKLASNISIGRDWAGVHYFTDYIESLRMGEQIAIGILEEQKLTYHENFSMTVPLYDGGSIRI